MKVKTSSYGNTVEILAANDYTAIPFTVVETTVVKAGQPMTLAGEKATFTPGESGTSGSTNADGILLYDVDPSQNPNAALVVRGVIDQKKAEMNSGVTYNVQALKTAVPGIVLRANTGVKDTE